MSQQEKQEQKNKRIGLLTSIGVHSALLLLFLFAMAWRAPDPPLPEFGIIVNVGFDDQGSGDVQTDVPTTEPEVQTEEVQEEETEPEPQPVVEDKPVAKVEQNEVVTSTIESPVAVEKKEEKVKEEPKKDKEPEKLKTEFTKEDAKKTDQSTQNKGEKTPSEGDDKDKEGNKGEPKGTLDPNGQYTGKPGGGSGGDGMSLSMSGWAWSKNPDTRDIPDNESGRVVFEIECDDSGEIIGIKTIERGVSAATEQRLKNAIMNTSLMRTIDGGKIPERSTGKVTFVIKSR